MSEAAQPSQDPNEVFERVMSEMPPLNEELLGKELQQQHKLANSNNKGISEVDALLNGEDHPTSDDQEVVEGDSEEAEEQDLSDAEDNEELSAEAEEGEAEEEVEQKLSTKAEARFQKLANERNELRQQLEQQSAQVQQMQAYLQQQEQARQQAQYSKQEELAQAQLEQLKQQRAWQEKAEERDRLAQMSALDRMKYDLESAAIKRAEEAISPKLKELEAKLQERETRERQYQEQYQRQQRLNEFMTMNAQATEPVLSVFDEQAKAQYATDFNDAVLAYAAAMRLPPDQAAKKFQGVLDAYHKAKLTSKVKANGSAPKSVTGSGQRKAPALPQGRAGKDYVEWPSMSQLRQHGYEDHVSWISSGSPKL